MADPSPALREPAHLVSPRARSLWRIGALIRTIVVIGVALAIVLPNAIGVPVWLWILAGLTALAYVAGMPAYRYRVHRWESTATAAYTQRGWLTIERRIAPMSRVQTVDLEQGPVSRLFRLATVTVTTASAAGPLKIEGLDHAVALALVEELTGRAEAEPGDAT